MNDALKEKDYTSNELVSAIDIAAEVYGKDPAFLIVAKKQNRVLLNRGGTMIAAALTTANNTSVFPYKSVEYVDGAKGNEGGISLLRSGANKDLSTLIFKYTAHGLSHGHYDKLNLQFYDQGNEILQDYGAVRFIGVEQKYGGRYLPESKSYAAQTIAHNTLVVDEKSHYNGVEDVSEKFHPEKLFSDISKSVVQVVSAKEINAYKDVVMQRTEYMIQVPGCNKLLVDLFNVKSTSSHQYDLPFQYNGHLINTSFKYEAATKKQETLGKKSGYQFLWKEAEAAVGNRLAQFTFLNERTYYTISSFIGDTATLYFTRAGANDPNFNLRHEPSYIIRKNGNDQVFLNVVEVHGNFDPIMEFSSNSYPSVKDIRIIQNDNDYTLAEILFSDNKILIAQSNNNFGTTVKHSINKAGYNAAWTGPYTVLYNGKNL